MQRGPRGFRTDVATSQRMAAIRQRDTSPEAAVRTAMKELGIRFRANVRSLPGSPDIANKAKKFAVFVQGCFWHHHAGCKRATIPRRNRALWTAKFAQNRKRDERVAHRLSDMGYRVVVIWECEAERPAAVRSKLRGLSGLQMRKPRRVNVR